MKTNNFLLMLYVWLYPQNRGVPKESATWLQEHSPKVPTLLLGRALHYAKLLKPMDCQSRIQVKN
jgi:hypothetical protein